MPLTSDTSQASADARADDGYSIALQPICDADFQHVGDELLYRASASDAQAAVSDPLLATARASSMAIYEIGLDKLIGDRLLFLKVSREWLERPELLPFPANNVVIEVLDDGTPLDDLAGALALIKQRGYRLALDASAVLQGDVETLSRMADIIKLRVDEGIDSAQLEIFRDAGCQLLAQRLETRDDVEAAGKAGCALLQGFFFAQPSNVAPPTANRRSNPSIQIKLIRELYREMVNIDRLADMIAQDPHLYLIVIKRANSSYYAQTGGSSLRRSLHVLGINELRTLVATVMLAQNGPVSRLTLKHALTRATMCKRLAEPFSRLDPEDAFTTGLFSLMDNMLGVDMADLLAEVELNATISTAISAGSGQLGAILTIARDYQAFVALDDVEQARQAIPPNAQLRAAYLGAVQETQALMSSLQEDG
ncbi:EAL and modified HD-GYP domain-containing signal transduction protein [Franzmannia pantelleriensis]|uniref:EAL and modified HD-GYP domain-containing signal transduction protein n=1 Tax=Franzmannia pantelleriensis TaxID=48727 RepID=A0A1G9EP62_9GAMM|nr:HDOD domain-containing protein [Halomonas pantelleriensis]SDK77920.1 EAL and modified HD-GYP domain-containing signal transduction protein [Halomonas pantelleriensis]